MKLCAVCCVCGADAPFTRRLTSDKAVEVVGGAEMYVPICRQCFGLPLAQVKDVIGGGQLSPVKTTGDNVAPAEGTPATDPARASVTPPSPSPRSVPPVTGAPVQTRHVAPAASARAVQSSVQYIAFLTQRPGRASACVLQWLAVPCCVSCLGSPCACGRLRVAQLVPGVPAASASCVPAELCMPSHQLLEKRNVLDEQFCSLRAWLRVPCTGLVTEAGVETHQEKTQPSC